MYLMIIQNKESKSINIDGCEHKISQFANDTTLILNGTKQSLTAALDTLKIFGSISGLTINVEKTKIIWIGNKINSAEKNEY